MSDERFVRSFGAIGKENSAWAGGKAAFLGEMTRKGFPVPAGFVVSTAAYLHFVERNGLRGKLIELAEAVDPENVDALWETAKELQQRVLSADMPQEIAVEIQRAYQKIGEAKLGFGNLGVSDLPFVAVRSSAAAADSKETGFAGLHESYLHVHGRQAVVEAVQRCWASLFTARALYHRKRHGLDTAKAAMGVVVQRMVDASVSGAVFSTEPGGDQGVAVVEAAWGLGPSVVGGSVKPDSYLVDKGSGKIVERDIAHQESRVVRAPRGVRTESVPGDFRGQQKLEDRLTKELALSGIKLEKLFGFPVEVEWAKESSDVFLVQASPLNALSKPVARLRVKDAKPVVRGMAASPGLISGFVRVVNGVEGLGNVQQGDVLVAKKTEPAWVVAMRKCVAVAVDDGGRMSHAALAARELGIPCVVGTGNATEMLVNGREATVDGFHGAVYEGKHEGVEVADVEEGDAPLPVAAGVKAPQPEKPAVPYQPGILGAAENIRAEREAREKANPAKPKEFLGAGLGGMANYLKAKRDGKTLSRPGGKDEATIYQPAVKAGATLQGEARPRPPVSRRPVSGGQHADIFYTQKDLEKKQAKKARAEEAPDEPGLLGNIKRRLHLERAEEKAAAEPREKDGETVQATQPTKESGGAEQAAGSGEAWKQALKEAEATETSYLEKYLEKEAEKIAHKVTAFDDESILRFDYNDLVQKVKARQPKRILVQFPEGLRVKSNEIAKALREGTGAEVIVSLEPMFGACDLRDKEAKMLGCDLMVHLGHSKLYHESVPALYYPIDYKLKDEMVEALVKEMKKLGNVKKIDLTATSQFVKVLPRIKERLDKEGFEAFIGNDDGALKKGQVLGCDFRAGHVNDALVDIHLFFGDGVFHPLGLAFASKKPTYVFDALQLTLKDFAAEKDRYLRKRHALIALTQDAKKIGIILCTKIGQFRKKLADEAFALCRKHGKEPYLFVVDYLQPSFLLGLDCDAYVNTACPRIATDDAGNYPKPVITPDELKIALGEKSFNDYAFDEIRH